MTYVEGVSHEAPLTFVVHIGGNLDVTHLSVDRQFIKMFILLEGKFSTQIHIVPILIRSVDHHRIVVIKLGEAATGNSVCFVFHTEILIFSSFRLLRS